MEVVIDVKVCVSTPSAEFTGFGAMFDLEVTSEG